MTWLHASVPASKINLILSYGNDATKTPDINDVTTDVFYTFSDGVVDDVTAIYSKALYNPIVSVDLASGEYDHTITPRLTASNSNATVIYTVDGSEPSPTNGMRLNSYEGAVTFDTDGSHVLRAGVLVGGSVINQVARTYYLTGCVSSSAVNVYVSAEGDPYLYAWEEISGNIVAPVEWPGTRLTEKNDQGWYHYSQDVSASLNIILHNGSGAQTATIGGLTPGDYFFTYDGASGYTRVVTEVPSSAVNMGDDVFYCYFENSAPYADPYAWISNQTSIYTGSSWPGQTLGSPVGVASNGNLIYRWVYNGNLTTMPSKVIFSDNGKQATQTADFDFVNGGYYNANGLVGVVNSHVMTLADIVSKGEVGQEYIVANDLAGVWMNDQNQWLWVKDDNGDAVNIAYNTHSWPVPESFGDNECDQSNWAQLILRKPVGSDEAQALQNAVLLGQTVIGTLTDRDNPTIELSVYPVHSLAEAYTPNTFTPANFVEQTEYFMVQPKPQEYVNVKWAICREQLNDTTFVMSMPKSNGDLNAENLPGAFKATVKQGYWEDMTSFNPETSIREGYQYALMGIVRAIDGGVGLQAAFTPDDANHSPVSDKWELYIVSVNEALAPFMLGDVNDDGEIDINDVTALIAYVLTGDSTGINLDAADLYFDGEVDINDVTSLIDLVLKGH